MDPGRWMRDARRRLARLPWLRMARVPDAPALPVRDPWPGDPLRGAEPAARASSSSAGTVALLRPGGFADACRLRPCCARCAHGFTWLRDLRALGTDAARMRARALVAEWIAARAPGADRAAPRRRPAHASPPGSATTISSPPRADDAFRQRLMARLVADARALAAALPTEELDARALTALKGLIAAAVALPEHAAFLTRALRVLPQEIAPAGAARRLPLSSAARPSCWRRCRTSPRSARCCRRPRRRRRRRSASAIERMAPGAARAAPRRRRARAVQRQQGGERHAAIELGAGAGRPRRAARPRRSTTAASSGCRPGAAC